MINSLDLDYDKNMIVFLFYLSNLVSVWLFMLHINTKTFEQSNKKYFKEGNLR